MAAPRRQAPGTPGHRTPRRSRPAGSRIRLARSSPPGSSWAGRRYRCQTRSRRHLRRRAQRCRSPSLAHHPHRLAAPRCRFRTHRPWQPTPARRARSITADWRRHRPRATDERERCSQPVSRRSRVARVWPVRSCERGWGSRPRSAEPTGSDRPRRTRGDLSTPDTTARPPAALSTMPPTKAPVEAKSTLMNTRWPGTAARVKGFEGRPPP
jgi:hypothetical protein